MRARKNNLKGNDRQFVPFYENSLARALSVARLSAVLACALCAGCIMIPIPKDDDLIIRGHAPPPNAIAEVRTNWTDRATVLENLGPPAAIWEDERIFLYWWDARSARVYWMIVGAATGGGGGGGMAAGAFDTARPYALYLQFDEQERVRRMARVVRSRTGSMGGDLAKWARASHTT
jgi:hypothetical protein